MKRTPGVLPRGVAVCALGGRVGALVILVVVGENWRPVRRERRRRIVWLRQRIVRVTRAGRECQVRPKVPRTRRRRWDDIILNGGRASRIQRGVEKRMRTNKVVSAGRVVADVALDWVERYSVRRRKGSSRTSQRSVKVWSVARISSRVLRCWAEDSARLRFWGVGVQIVLERGL